MILCLLVSAALAQAPTESHSLRAVVEGPKGVALRDLEPSDVSLSEGGVTRTLTRFEKDERPISLALLIDSSQPMTSVYRHHFVEAAKAFVGSLPSNTHLSVWTTGDRPSQVLDNVDLSEDSATRDLGARLGRAAPIGGNTILDALVEVATALEKTEGDRKVIVFLSGIGPGFSNRDKHSVVDAVMRKGVEVAGVLASERGEASEGGEVSLLDYEFVFGALTEKTAGRLERPLSAMGASGSMLRVAADLRSTYRLDFLLPSGSRRSRMTLQVARPGAKARLSTLIKEAR